MREQLVMRNGIVKTASAHAADIAKESGWQPIETAPQFTTLLTIHEDDLFPVCAFYVEEAGKRNWFRVIEGPEDVIRSEEGDHGSLYRDPTHWMLPPDVPIKTRVHARHCGLRKDHEGECAAVVTRLLGV